MSFLFLSHRPRPLLRPYIKSIWYARGRVPYGEERILPTGTIVLLINLGDPFRITLNAGQGDARTQSRSWFCGLQSRFMVNRPLGETHMVGVTFGLAGAYPLLGLPLHQLADDTLEAEALWGSDAEMLRGRLNDAKDVASRFALVESALLARLEEPPARLSAIRWAAGRLTRPDALSVSSLAETLGFSHKHMIALFAAYVGHPPKTLERIARFNRVLGHLGDGQRAHWEQAALDCGYYDQAHFNRDFRAFSGINPSTYFDLRAPYHEDGLTPGQDVSFVPVA